MTNYVIYNWNQGGQDTYFSDGNRAALQQAWAESLDTTLEDVQDTWEEVEIDLTEVYNNCTPQEWAIKNREYREAAYGGELWPLDRFVALVAPLARFIGVAEIATLYNQPESTVRAAFANGCIPARKVGKTWITLEDMARYYYGKNVSDAVQIALETLPEHHGWVYDESRNMISNPYQMPFRFVSGIALMDARLRECLDDTLAVQDTHYPDPEAAFFAAYALAHKAFFGSDWVQAGMSPTA